MAAMRQFKSGQYASNGPRVPDYADGAVEAIRRIAPMLEKASGIKVLPKPEVRRSFVLNDASIISNRYDKPLGTTIWIGKQSSGQGLSSIRKLLVQLRASGLLEKESRLIDRSRS